MGHFGPRILVRSQSSESTLNIFLEFYALKVTKRHTKIMY